MGSVFKNEFPDEQYPGQDERQRNDKKTPG